MIGTEFFFVWVGKEILSVDMADGETLLNVCFL